MSNFKKINKVLAITLLVLSIIVLTDYSESASKYFKKNENLSFDAIVTSIPEGDGTIVLDEVLSNDVRAMFKYTVKRNNLMTDADEKDIYTIMIDKNCTFQNVKSTLDGKSTSYPIETVNQQTKKIDIAFDSQGEDEIEVRYSCTINLNDTTPPNDNITSTVVVNEKIEPDNTSFFYNRTIYTKKKSEYIKEILKEEFDIRGDSIVIPEHATTANIRTKIHEWIVSYIENYLETNKDEEHLEVIVSNPGPLTNISDRKYLNNLEKYLYQKLDDLKDINNATDLYEAFEKLNKDNLGFKVTQLDDGRFELSVDDDFVGYALTHCLYNEKTKYLFFSNVDATKDEIEEIFKFYIETYYGGDKEAAIEYINKKDGVYQVLRENGRIHGLFYDAGRLQIQDSFLRKESPINIDLTATENNTIVGNRRTNLSSYLNDQYSDVIPASYVTTLSNNPVLSNTLSNIRGENLFNDYLIFNIEGKNVLINLRNTIDSDTKVSSIEFSATEYLVESIGYENPTTISYSTTYTGKTAAELEAEVKQFAKELDDALGTGTKFTDYINVSMFEGLYANPRVDDRTNGVYATASQVTITFINDFELSDGTSYNKYPVGKLPVGTVTVEEVTSSSANNEAPSEDVESSNNDSINNKVPEEQQTTTPVTNKENEEVEEPASSEPEVNGE